MKGNKVLVLNVNVTSSDLITDSLQAAAVSVKQPEDDEKASSLLLLL